MNIAGVNIPDYMSGVPVLGPGKIEKTFYFGGMNHNGSAEDHCRNVYDGRYFYLRNYMPHLPYTQSQIYNDGAEILTFMRQDYKAGILTGAAAEYMAPTRPREALYDLKNDPWQVNNLANDPKHQKILNKQRARLREKILEIRDLHFLHAWEIETRGKDKTACEIRSNPDVYPLNKILEVAELTGGGASVLGRQLVALTDIEPMVRYWAIIGLQSQNWQKDAIQKQLIKRLDDDAPYVRYEAAKLCYKYSKNQKAKDVLVTGINESRSILVNNAMRKIRQLDKDAADYIPELKQFKETYNSFSALLEVDIREFLSAVNSFSLVGVRA